jgi:trimethylamine--corrinoid protein Co-methyltransferase
MNAASAQLSNWLGLVSGVASSMTDSKAIDAQYGAEKGVTALAAALSGANMIYESVGMTAALLGVSFEGFVLDNDMLGNIYRMLRGVEVTDENLGFDVIVDVVQGEGHFLGHPQTMAAMERDYFYPETADREAPITWRDRGSMDAQTRAKATARTLLQRHPTYLSAEADARIRAAFDIQLPPQR